MEIKTQVAGKLRTSGNNPSAEKIDFCLEGEKITEGQIDPLLIPRLSHIGRFKEILKPSNDPDSSREFVHRTETFDYDEFFPVHKDKSNARNAKYLFTEQRSTSGPELVHAAGSNGFLYMETSDVMWQLPDNFVGGWSHITLNNDINEYDAPFTIIPIKDPVNVTTNNWDRLFYVGNRFVTQSTWETTTNPTLAEIVNLSSDINVGAHANTITDIRGTEIFDACGGVSPLNMDKTAFMILDNKVYVYDYITNNSKYFWLDITETPLWTEAVSISCLEVSGNTILFVGTSDGEIYTNILASAEIEFKLDAGNNFIPQGNLDFKPNNIWVNDEFNYGYGYSDAIDFFDIFDIRGNNFGYGASGFGFGFEEKLPIKSGDALLFVTANTAEKRVVATATDTGLSLTETLQFTYNGQTEGLSNSMMLLDWFQIADGLSGEVKKIIFAQERLVAMTDTDVYISDTVGDISNLFFKEAFVWASTSAPSDIHNDINVIDGCLILASENSIYRGIWTGATFVWSVSENIDIATSLNDILASACTVIVDGDDVFVCGKFGIFKSVDKGLTWRNTMQIIGLPEDRTSSLTVEKTTLKVIDTDSSKNRIIAIKDGFPYGYGYGYGYGEGLDFFDVFGLDSTGLGYGLGDFEQKFSGTYGYGTGLEILNILESIQDNDWIFFSDNSGSIYKDIPLKIIDFGISEESRLFYIDVELADAEFPDFTQIIENQTFSVYRKKEPLGIIDCVPQDVRYDSTDITDYFTDYFRQSIEFDSSINPDKEVEIASDYKAFEPIEQSIIGLTIDKVEVNGLEVTPEDRDVDTENFITLQESGNIDDIVKITIKETNITDVGTFTHEELEDELSKEELGLPYKFEGVRTSNLLASMMAMQHLYPNFDTTDITEITGTTTFVEQDYIEDTSRIFAPGSLVGRRIILDSDNKNFDYTIENNNEHTIFLARFTSFENLTTQANGVATSFQLEKPAALGTLSVFIDGTELTLTADYTETIINSEIVGLVFVEAPQPDQYTIISYISSEDNVDFRNITSIGDSYEIIGINTSPFADLTNTFLTMFDNEDVLDVEFSFIENSILISNENIGRTTQASFYVYFNPFDDFIYAGTNKGIWKREKDVSIWCKTSELLPTIDGSGVIDIADSINGAFIQYDKDDKEWTVTWGLGVDQKDINDNLGNIDITAIAHNPTNTDIILAGSQEALYRTFDGGDTWEVVWEFTLDDRIKDNPIPRQIVWDDKNPWIVNVVNQSGLFRSFDYGNTFEIIANYDIERKTLDASRSFSYQQDSTDIRSNYYYGENVLQFKNTKTLSSFGGSSTNISKTRQRDIIGIDLGDLVIRSIAVNPENVNEVFIGSDVYGLLKSTIMGNDPMIARSEFNKNYANFTSELINEITNPNDADFINNTGAWHFLPDPDRTNEQLMIDNGTPELFDPDAIVGRYFIFVDRPRNRTYIITKIGLDRRVPEKGEFVGKFIRINANREVLTFRILEHYTRGILPSGANIRNLRDDNIQTNIVEFVLEGQYPFLYNSANLPLGQTVEDYDYYWYGETDFSITKIESPTFVQFGFPMPLFTQSMGDIDRIQIADGNLFEINSDNGLVTTASYRRSDIIDTTASGGGTVFTLIKPSVDTFGFSFDFADKKYGVQLFLDGDFVGETDPEIDPTITFTVGTDTITATISDGGATVIATTDVTIDSSIEVEMRLIVRNETTRQKEVVVNIDYPTFSGSGTPPPSEFEVKDGLKGFYFGDIQAEERYEIVESISRSLTPDLTALFFARIAIRIDPTEAPILRPDELDSYVRLWNQGATNAPPNVSGFILHSALYHDSIIESVTSSSIKFTKGRLPTVATAGFDLKGYVIYPRPENNSFFEITSNTEDTVFVASNNTLTNLARVGDTARFGTNIQSGRILDIVIDPNNTETLYVSAVDNPYVSFDGGKSWRLINDGLSFDNLNKQTLVTFEKLRFLGTTLYSCAPDFAANTGGGVFRFDGSTWTQIGGIDGDGLIDHSINDFSVFESGGVVTIYAGSKTDGVYKGSNETGSFIWTRQNLPEHIVNEIELTKQTSGELTRSWIGTEGRGLWKKDGIDDETWERDLQNNLLDVEIKSNIWRSWNIFEQNDEVIVDALFADTDQISFNTGIFDTRSYFQNEYGPIDSPGLEALDIFDWNKNLTINDNKEEPFIFSIDQSNAGYFSELIDRTITSFDYPETSKLTSYISGIKGSGGQSEAAGVGVTLRGIAKETNALGIEKVNVSGDHPTIYEEPFRHLPDRKSITAIEETDAGRVFFGTDRSGVWRTKSGDGKRYLLPFVESPSDSFDLTQYGYDYVSLRLERERFTEEDDFPGAPALTQSIRQADPTGEIGFVEGGNIYDGVRTTGQKFKAEKIYSYTISSSDSPDFFADIDGKESLLVGGYLIIAGDITEGKGVQGNNRFVLEITKVTRVSGDIKLFLTAGTRGGIGLPPSELSDFTWDNLDAEIESPSGDFTKICIIDFESYENISGNLPKLDVKDARGDQESGVFIRDLKIVGSQAVIACGIGGLFLSKDVNNIDPTTIDWFNIELPPGVTDVTSVIAVEVSPSYGFGYGYGLGLDYFDVLGVDGALVGYGVDDFETINAYSYGYGFGHEFSLNIFIGTWGNGVWAYRGGVWIGDIFTGGTWEEVDPIGINHKKVWTLFRSSDDILYAGTEHGGIYRTPISHGDWTREIDNVVRSKLFLWKTEGVPTRQSVTTSNFDDSNKLLSYSFGGGIMRSLDEGDGWEQSNSGLENFYVQDITVCSDPTSDVAYAATAGGGVFKTTDAFDGSCTWTQVSTAGLPDTLNIDEIEVGLNPDVIYIKTRVNDLSFKDLPFGLKNLAATPADPNFEFGEWKGSLDGSLFNGDKFTPLQPFIRGQRKAIVYRSVDGGSSWEIIYDKDPDLVGQDYTFSSAVFGLTINPVDDSLVYLLYKSCLTSNNQDIGNIDQFLFVTLDDGEIDSEVPFPFDSFQNLKLFNQRSDAYITVNPRNTAEIYIALHGEVGKNRNLPPIYKSSDGGRTWEYIVGNFTSTESFNTKVRISNKSAGTVSATTSDVSSSLILTGVTSDLSQNTSSFEETTEFILENFNRIIVTNFSQDTAVDPFGDSLFFTFRDEPVPASGNAREYPRPFYLVGANLQPNINQPTVLSVSDGGSGDFLPRRTRNVGDANNPQFVTLVLSETFRANLLDPITNTCRLSNLTSLKFDYSSLPATSIFRKENTLVGLDISVLGVTRKVAIHRVLYSSTTATTPDKVEIVIIGDIGSTAGAGTSVTVTLQPAIYSNYDNDLMVSVNGGISWKKFGKEVFSIALDNVKAAANNSELPSGVERSTYILQDEGEDSVVYRGDVADDRYDEESPERIVWSTVVPRTTFKSNDTLPEGLAYSGALNAIFISENNKISSIDIFSTTVETLFENLTVSVPVVVSEADTNNMAFIANNSIYTSKDGFENFQIFTLPDLINPGAIQKIVMSKNPEIPDEIFLCVDNGQIFDQTSSAVIGITSFGPTNFVTLPIFPGQTNPFTGFENRFISFEQNNVTSIFNTRIGNITSNNVYTLDTILGDVASFEFNSITNRTSLRCNGNSPEITDYIGTAIALQIESEEITSFFVGRIEEIDNITQTTFDVIVNGDLRATFESNDIEFTLRFPFYRLGRLTDFLGTGFVGRATANRASSQTIQNGLWYSNTFGEGFVKVDALSIGGVDDRPGCTDVHIFDDGHVSPILTNDGIRRLMLNDKFLPSSNINRVFTTPDGNIIALTSNGMVIISGDDDPQFNNFFYNNFTRILDLGANQFYLFDSEDNTYILNGLPTSFFGNETPTLTDFTFIDVNVAFLDSKNALWIGTEGSGLFAIFNNTTFNFTSENSELGSNNIRDFTEDSRNNLWVATGDGGVSTGFYGDDVNTIPAIEWDTFRTGIGFTEDSGLTGEINAIKERTTMNIVADGTITVPQVTVRWVNNSSVFPNTLIMRSENSAVTPNVPNGTAFTTSPIRDTVLTITEETDVSGNLLWRVTGSANIDYGTSNFVGKYIIPDTRNNSDNFEIVANTFNTFDFARTEGEPTPAIGSFIVTDKIDESFLVYTGDGLDVNFEFIDRDIKNNTNYTYFLFFFNDGSFTYKLTDSRTAQVSSTEVFSDNQLDVVCGGGGGLFRFTPNEDQDFTFIVSFGEENAVTDIFFDTSNIGWIAAGDKLVEFNAPNTTTEFGLEDLFVGKSELLEGQTLVVNNAAERANGDIIIATTLGLSVRDESSFESFIDNDPDRILRAEDGTLSLSSWRPAELLDENANDSSFIKGDENEAFLAVLGNILVTENKGANWTIENTEDENFINDDIRFAHKALETDGTIKDLVFIADRAFYSSGSNDIDQILLENLPTRVSTEESYSIGDMWLSEGTSSITSLIVGLFNDNVVEDERELALLDFSSSNELTLPVTFITGRDGLSIQSTYAFAELLSGSDSIICAGCKDSVIFKKNTDPWTIFQTNEVESDTFVYTSLAARTDPESIEHEKTLYATRTTIYGTKFTPSVVSLRIDSSVTDKVFTYDLNGSLAGGINFGIFTFFPTDSEI